VQAQRRTRGAVLDAVALPGRERADGARVQDAPGHIAPVAVAHALLDERTVDDGERAACFTVVVHVDARARAPAEQPHVVIVLDPESHVPTPIGHRCLWWP